MEKWETFLKMKSVLGKKKVWKSNIFEKKKHFKNKSVSENEKPFVTFWIWIL